MKKLLFVPALVGLMFFNSCQQSDSPGPTGEQLAAIAGADAEAMIITAESLAPSGLEVANPLVFGIFVAGAGAYASGHYAHEIGVFITNDNNNERMLPSAYMLAQNPYELLGVVHNKNLISYHGMVSAFSEGIFQDDALLLQLIHNYGSFDNQQAARILADLKSFNATTGIYKTIADNAKFIVATKADIRYCTSISDYQRNYLANFMADVANMEKSGDFKERLYNKINKAVSDLLSSESVDAKGIIIFLTTYKHSYEYWF